MLLKSNMAGRQCVRLHVFHLGAPTCEGRDDCVDFLFLFACLLLTCRLLKPGYSDTAVIAQSEAPASLLMSPTIDVRLTLPTSPPAPHFLSYSRFLFFTLPFLLYQLYNFKNKNSFTPL